MQKKALLSLAVEHVYRPRIIQSPHRMSGVERANSARALRFANNLIEPRKWTSLDLFLAGTRQVWIQEFVLPNDGQSGWHIPRDYGLRADGYIVADVDITDDCGACAERNVLANFRMAIAALLARASQCDAVQHGAVVPNHGSFADHD